MKCPYRKKVVLQEVDRHSDNSKTTTTTVDFEECYKTDCYAYKSSGGTKVVETCSFVSKAISPN